MNPAVETFMKGPKLYRFTYLYLMMMIMVEVHSAIFQLCRDRLTCFYQRLKTDDMGVSTTARKGGLADTLGNQTWDHFTEVQQQLTANYHTTPTPPMSESFISTENYFILEKQSTL